MGGFARATCAGLREARALIESSLRPAAFEISDEVHGFSDVSGATPSAMERRIDALGAMGALKERAATVVASICAIGVYLLCD